MRSRGNPRGERTDFKADFRADIGFLERRGIADIDGVRSIRVDAGREAYPFVPEKIVQLRAECFGDVGRRQTVNLLLELVLFRF
jgi:hypothetical protein